MRKPTFCGRNRVNVPDSGCDDCAQLMERLDLLEACCQEVRTWKDTIDAWKSTIDTWKTNVTTWMNNTDTWKSGINTWKTSMTNWQTTINSWKNGIDTWRESLATDLTSIKNRLTNLETWENTIDSWKEGIDNWKSTIITWKNTIDSWKNNIDTNGYNALSNKPTINGVTVQGNKTSEDYLITAITVADIETLTPIECYVPPCADSRACYGETCCMIVGSDE